MIKYLWATALMLAAAGAAADADTSKSFVRGTFSVDLGGSSS